MAKLNITDFKKHWHNTYTRTKILGKKFSSSLSSWGGHHDDYPLAAKSRLSLYSDFGGGEGQR